MELIFLLLTILGIIIAIIFGYLQVVVPFIKGEVRFSRRFPFVETAEAGTAAKPRRRRKKKGKHFLIPILAIGILIIIFVLINSLVLQARAAERVPIAVITFKNRTGEQRFDYLCEAIPNLLITNLEQSKHLSIMTWERMHDLLKVLGKEDVRAVDEGLGFEICEMDDIHAIVIGSFTKAGEIFVTEVKVLDVRTKRLLKSASSEGEGVASILKTQIDDLSKDIARGVSRYERVIETTKFTITEATTSSMDAYAYFLRGRDDFEKLYHEDARRFLEKAIELDSTFAMAYLYLATTYGHLRNYDAMRESFEKAKKFGNKVTEKERLYIEAYYAWFEGDREKEFRIYKEIVKRYPKEKRVRYDLGEYYREHSKYHEAIVEFKKVLELDPNYKLALLDLSYSYANVGNYEKAIECMNRLVLISPGDANPFDSMGDIYELMGELDKALAKYKEALEVKPDFPFPYLKIAYIYALKENYAETMKWIDQRITMVPSPGRKAIGYEWKGFFHYWLGSLDQSLKELSKAEELWQVAESEPDKININRLKAWIGLEQGDFALSRRHIKNRFDFHKEFNPSYIAVYTAYYNFCLGFINLRQGRIESAKSNLVEMKALFPELDSAAQDLMALRYDILMVEVLITEDSIKEAIALCEKALFFRRRYRDPLLLNMEFSKDQLARAYIKGGDLDKAIAEYERLTTFDPKSKDRRLVRPIHHYQLAVLYEEKDLKVKAIAEFEKFLKLWKDADADRPEKIDAKKRLAKLKEIS